MKWPRWAALGQQLTLSGPLCQGRAPRDCGPGSEPLFLHLPWPGWGRDAGSSSIEGAAVSLMAPGFQLRGRCPRGDRVTQPSSRAPAPSRSSYRLCLQLPPLAASVAPCGSPVGLRGCLGTWQSGQRESLGPWPRRGWGERPPSPPKSAGCR